MNAVYNSGTSVESSTVVTGVTLPLWTGAGSSVQRFDAQIGQFDLGISQCRGVETGFLQQEDFSTFMVQKAIGATANVAAQNTKSARSIDVALCITQYNTDNTAFSFTMRGVITRAAALR